MLKKEEGDIDGIVSNYLHSNINVGDVLTIGMPSGEFVLKEKKKPIVFISGGIGVTPLISMFNEVAGKNKNQEIIFIQCALNSESHAFFNEVEDLINKDSKLVVVYSSPLKTDHLGTNYDYQGFLTPEILKDLNISNESEFYFCGPTPFMANVLKILNFLDVDENNINYEFFGPAEALMLVH